MKGFDKRWRDFPHYINGITKEIWEDRGLGARMKDYYHKDVVVRSPLGVSVGEPAMTAATMATLVEFPDRVLLGEDVIWSGTPQEGMLSSHRILSQAHHRGDGAFGAASGKRVCYRTIADCYARDNQISDEWLVRDNGAILRQIGRSPQEWARAEIQAGRDQMPFVPAADKPGPYKGRGNTNAWGAAYGGFLGRIMAAEFSVIGTDWDRACHLEYPGGVTAHGRAAADGFWLGLRASFPSARFEIHHVIGREDEMMAPRAAVRWSLSGKHDGWGAFGAPTGAFVHVMGISHAEFGPGGLRREWVVYDETAIWKQIVLHQG